MSPKRQPVVRVDKMMAKRRDERADGDYDEVDRVLANANPNPRRVGCLSREALESLAARRQPLNAPGYEHLLECSECYKEFRALQGGEVSES
jgi:hypothetical protein